MRLLSSKSRIISLSPQVSGDSIQFSETMFAGGEDSAQCGTPCVSVSASYTANGSRKGTFEFDPETFTMTQVLEPPYSLTGEGSGTMCQFRAAASTFPQGGVALAGLTVDPDVGFVIAAAPDPNWNGVNETPGPYLPVTYEVVSGVFTHTPRAFAKSGFYEAVTGMCTSIYSYHGDKYFTMYYGEPYPQWEVRYASDIGHIYSRMHPENPAYDPEHPDLDWPGLYEKGSITSANVVFGGLSPSIDIPDMNRNSETAGIATHTYQHSTIPSKIYDFIAFQGACFIYEADNVLSYETGKENIDWYADVYPGSPDIAYYGYWGGYAQLGDLFSFSSVDIGSMGAVCGAASVSRLALAIVPKSQGFVIPAGKRLKVPDNQEPFMTAGEMEGYARQAVFGTRNNNGDYSDPQNYWSEAVMSYKPFMTGNSGSPRGIRFITKEIDQYKASTLGDAEIDSEAKHTIVSAYFDNELVQYGIDVETAGALGPAGPATIIGVVIKDTDYEGKFSCTATAPLGYDEEPLSSDALVAPPALGGSVFKYMVTSYIPLAERIEADVSTNRTRYDYWNWELVDVEV